MDKYRILLYEKLKNYVERGTIPAFKILNRSDSEELEKKLGNNENSSSTTSPVNFAQNARIRLFNSPVTIYLHDDFSPAQIADLCPTEELKAGGISLLSLKNWQTLFLQNLKIYF